MSTADEHISQRLAARRLSALRRWLAFVGVALSIVSLGCSTYQIGAQSLYRSDIRTVHVPIFESNSFRRSLGEQLTESVVKQIELKTPYKVVCAADADSVLSGRVITDIKQVLAEDLNGVPRDVVTGFTVLLRWEDRRGSLLQQPAAVPLPPELLINEDSNLVPAAGQTVATAHQRVVEQLAEQIVSQMEYAW